MEGDRHFHFFSQRRSRDPYIKELIDYAIDGDTGYIEFDGYYYAKNEEFPIRIFYSTFMVEKEGKRSVDENGHVFFSHNMYDLQPYEIEIYDRVFIENTSKYGDIEDEDGGTMSVCFFPMHRQKIFFKVIQAFPTEKEMYERREEVYGKDE